MRLRREFCSGGGEDFGVGHDIGFGGGGGHEGHVVERSEEDAAIEGVEVEEAFEVEVGGSGGVAAVSGRLGGESVLRTGTQLDHMPGKTVGTDFGSDAIVDTLRERDHAFERGGCKDVFESGAHGG